MTKFKQIGITFADWIASFIGSWTFIILQSLVVILWITLNIFHLCGFDPYPFILLNLFFSTEAAYATPLILMASIRQSAKDSEKLSRDLELDSETNKIMKNIESLLESIQEDLDLDRISLQDHKNMRKDIKKILQEIKK